LEHGWWSKETVPNLKQHLDLVTLAIAADMVPLIGENHILVRQGMQVLIETRKPGLRALLRVAGVDPGRMSPSHLGFTLSPRINASGRMGSAEQALRLLITRDEEEGVMLAQELEEVNRTRMETQNRIWDEVKLRVEEGLALGKFQHGVVVGDPSWHEGVVGIVAARVAESFGKPAVVIAFREDGTGKGSARSFAGKNILEALQRCRSILLGLGGHAHAAGLSLFREKFSELQALFDQACGELREDAEQRPLYFDSEISLSEMSEQTLLELEDLGPYGPGHPEPTFHLRADVRNLQVLKERHLKFEMVPASEGERPLQAMWFYGIEKLGEASIPEGCEWLGTPELNRFRGKVTPTFRVKDFRRPSS
jgi:single-stranded-DNA-specific exonuclease